MHIEPQSNSAVQAEFSRYGGTTTAELDRDGLLVDGLARKSIATSRILAALNDERGMVMELLAFVSGLTMSKEPDQRTHDAIVALTAIAICGTDLHMIRGTLSGMRKGTILGHDGIGSVGEIGKGIKNYFTRRPRCHPLDNRPRHPATVVPAIMRSAIMQIRMVGFRHCFLRRALRAPGHSTVYRPKKPRPYQSILLSNIVPTA